MSRTLVRLKEELQKLPPRSTKVPKRSNDTQSRSYGAHRAIPESREERLKLYEELVGRSRKADGIQRCRPRLPIIPIRALDPDTKEYSTADVSYLQDNPDQLEALRECIEIMFQSSTEIYKRLDLNGCGQLSFNELLTGLNRLKIPWQQVTGLTRAEFLKLLGTGPVDLLTFLGRTQLTSRPHWSQLPLKAQWEDYCNKIIDLDLGNTSYSPPLWTGMSPTSNPSRPPSQTSTPLTREDLDFIQSKIVRIEKFLSDFVEHKRDLIKLKLELSSVTESEDRAAEMKRKREEEEKEKQRIKRAAGMALVTTDGNNKISIFGKKSISSVFIQPTKDDLAQAFDGLVSDQEREFRRLLNDIGLPLLLGDKIRTAIRACTSQSRPETINEEEFQIIINMLTKGSSHKIMSDWVSLSQGRSRVSIKEFYLYCARPETGIFMNV